MYVLAVKFLGDVNHYESDAIEVNGYTQWAAPASVDQVLTVDYRAEVIKFNSGFNPADYDVKINNSLIANADNYSLTSYANGANFTISVAHKTSPTSTYYPASVAVTRSVAARLAGPGAASITVTKASSAVADDGSIALSGGFEFRSHRDVSQLGGWVPATGSASVGFGSYDVRRPATDTVFASAATTVAVGAVGVWAVTYNAGTGSGTPPVQTGGNAGASTAFTTNSAVSVLGPGSLSKSGYGFVGWSVSPAVTFNGTANTTSISAADANGTKTFVITADTTLTAQWAPKPTVTSVTPSGVNANASGTVTIVFSEDMATTAGTVAVATSGSSTTLTGAGSWVDATTYQIPYGALAYSTSYTYTISGFTSAAGVLMDANTGSLSFTTIANPTRTVTGVAQYGGTNGKVASTGIKVTFNQAVTTPPASAFTVSQTGGGSTTTVTKGQVSDAGDSDDKTWVIGVTGDWVNGASDVTVAITANWGGYTITPLPATNTVPVMFAPQPIPFTTPGIDYQNETLTGLTGGYTYNYKYTNAASTVVTGSFTTAAGVTTTPIDAAWMTGVSNGFQIQQVAEATDAFVDSLWQSVTIPARRPASAVTGAGVTPSSQAVAGVVTGQISGLTTAMQYRTAAGGWKTFTGSGTYPDLTSITETSGTVGPLVPGTYYVRLNYSSSEFVSEGQFFLVRTYGAVDFGQADQGYSPISPLNVQDTINGYFTDPGDEITVTDVSLGANSDFVKAGSGSGITLAPVSGLVPGVYSEPVTVSRVGGSGAFGLMSPTADLTVNGVAAFAAVNPALADGDSATASSTLTVKFAYPITGLDSTDFSISGGATQADIPSVTTNDGLTYTIAIQPTSPATRDQETINIVLTLPTTPGAGGMTDIYAHQKTTIGSTISTTANVRVPRAIDESKTLTHSLPGYATSYVQFTLMPDPYYPTPDLENLPSEVSVVGDNTNGTPGAAVVDHVARVDASLSGGFYYTFRVYLTDVTAGDVTLKFATFTALNTSDYVTLTAGASPGSRAYFLQTSTVDSSKYQNIPTDLTSGAQVLPAVTVTGGGTAAPATSFLTSVDLDSNKTVTKVLLNGTVLNAALWTAAATSSLDYSYDGGPWITPTSPMLLTLNSGFTNLNGSYELDVIFSDDSYLFGQFSVTGITSAYSIALSQTGTCDFGNQQRGYLPQTPISVDVTNTGNQATGVLSVQLGGGSSSGFTTSTSSLASIANHGSASDAFTIAPKTGLARGTYTDTVTVSGGNSINASFDVRFEVLNTAPVVASGQGTQSGTAVPASGGGVVAAVAYTANVSGWFTDVDGDTLTYRLVSNGFAGTVDLNPATGALSFTPVAADAATTATIVVGANDGLVNSSSNTTITVAVGAVAPLISPQPVSANYWTDTPAASVTALTVGVTGQVGVLSYQWYTNSTASNTGGTVITGATSSSYKPVVSTAGTRHYFVAVTATPANAGPSATVRSAAATIVATARPADAVAPTFATSPASRIDYKTTGQTADALSFVLNPNGNGTLTYQWYSNTTASTTGGTAITGATGVTYTPSISTPGTRYYFVEVTASVPNAKIPVASRRSDTATITSVNRQYTVEFNIGYDTSYGTDVSGEEPKPVHGDINTNIILPTNTGNPDRLDFTRTNYSFGGWDTIQDGLDSGAVGNVHYGVGSPYTSGSDNPPVILFAAWIENFAVIFDSAGGSSVPGVHVDTPTTYGAATGGTLPAPTRPGYDLDGWYLEAVDGVEVTSTPVADGDLIDPSALHNVKLVAHWTERPPVDVKFVASPDRGGSISPDGDLQVPPATGEIAARDATPNRGYTFTNWTDQTDTVISADTTLIPQRVDGLWVAQTYTANFDPKQVNVNFDTTGGNTITPVTVVFDDPYGTLPLPVRAGWTFTGWYTTATGGTLIDDSTIVSVDATVQILYAHWTQNLYAVLQDFGDYSGTGTATARIDYDNINEFVRLVNRDTSAVIAKANYTVTSGSTVITLAHAYLQTLNVGTYYYIAEYSNGQSQPIKLVVTKLTNTATPQPTGSPTASPTDGATAKPTKRATPEPTRTITIGPGDPTNSPGPGGRPGGELSESGNPLPDYWTGLIAALTATGLVLLAYKRRKTREQ